MKTKAKTIREFTRLLADQTYLNAYAAACQRGAPDCSEEDRCDHLRHLLESVKDVTLAEPGTETWHQERRKYFTASTLSVLIDSDSPRYGGRHLSYSKDKLVLRRAASLALQWFGVRADVEKKEQADSPAMAHGRAMEPLAVWVLRSMCEQAGLEMHGITHVPCCRHRAIECLAFTPDYVMCVRDPARNTFRSVIVEVKSPYSRAYDPQQPAPYYLYPQVVACATGLGLEHAALLQMWKDRAVYTTVAPTEMRAIWSEVQNALFRAEQQARDVAMHMANQHLLSLDAPDSRRNDDPASSDAANK